MDDLRAQAQELGIPIDGRWSEETLRQKIDEALTAPADPREAQTADPDRPKTLAELNAEQREIDKAIGGYDRIDRRARRIQKILRAQVK